MVKIDGSISEKSNASFGSNSLVSHAALKKAELRTSKVFEYSKRNCVDPVVIFRVAEKSCLVTMSVCAHFVRASC